MKYKLHIGYCNRPDLAKQAAESVRAIGNVHIWACGVPEQAWVEGAVHHTLPPLANVGNLNHFIKESWDDDVMFWMHNDGWAKPGFAPRLLEYVQDAFANRPRWGVVFTLYDILCCFNMKAVRDIGYWDTMYFQYSVDIDYYHHMLMKHWEIETFGRDQVLHRDTAPTPEEDGGGGGSHAVRTDPLHNYRVQWRERTRFDDAYFKFKWGTDRVGYEKDRKLGFRQPFQNFDAANAPGPFDKQDAARNHMPPPRRPGMKA